ncbi:protochlorophyllide-dependent translocon component 52, chloroplastic-like [Silene latifolia]|uniref:protochlorophyllide-dependent translocon component 52, chloroplastic-like n=1 Tax=Silene latifolia TaxID=37657 RepID=UPI003D77B838
MATNTISMSTIRTRLDPTHFHRQSFKLNHPSLSSTRFSTNPTKFKLYCSNSSPNTSTATTTETAKAVIEEVYEKSAVPAEDTVDEKFDWYSEWYAMAPLSDLDKKVPHGMTIMGIKLVVWWDRNEEQWKVFDDSCPHRLAPLSEGRIDKWGRLQCVYHGWCFNGSGSCKFIPQAPLDTTPVHTSKKACVASYPCTVQHDILWFWPNSDPKYRDILTKKQPPYIPELEDPNYTRSMGVRDLPYGYEILVENIMDPAHVPYAHYGLMPPMPVDKTKPIADRENGRPMNFSVEKIEKSGFSGNQPGGYNKFMAPCIFYMAPNRFAKGTEDDAQKKEQERRLLIFICIPVSPGKCRAILVFPRNFMQWIDKIIPRWAFHIVHNLVLDSDLKLLHGEEQRLLDKGGKWQKAYYMPTKADAMVIAFRKWLDKYAGEGVDWGNKYESAQLPPTPPKDVLLDRYWSHTVNCTSCSKAYKGFKLAQTVLQISSFALIGIIGLVKQKPLVFATALLCFAASKFLSTFIYKNFHFHDYNHAHVKDAKPVMGNVVPGFKMRPLNTK